MSGAERKALKQELKALQRRQTNWGFGEPSAPVWPTRLNYARRARYNALWYAGRDREISASIAAIYDRLRAPAAEVA